MLPPYYETLEGPTIINAERSLLLQDVAPELKPAVKGTSAEIRGLQAAGRVGEDKSVFIVSPGVAYIIALGEVSSLLGAKLDLISGGDKESDLLGYPRRAGLNPEQKISAAVTLDGEVVTDLGEMKSHAEGRNLIWAAEGLPAETIALAERVATAWIAKENQNGLG